ISKDIASLLFEKVGNNALYYSSNIVRNAKIKTWMRACRYEYALRWPFRRRPGGRRGKVYRHCAGIPLELALPGFQDGLLRLSNCGDRNRGDRGPGSDRMR